MVAPRVHGRDSVKESRGLLRDNLLIGVGAAETRAMASAVMKSVFMVERKCYLDRFVRDIVFG